MRVHASTDATQLERPSLFDTYITAASLPAHRHYLTTLSVIGMTLVRGSVIYRAHSAQTQEA